MIAGVALLDYDNDGRLDVYFCNGATIPGLEKSDASFSNRLYRNGPGLVFEDVTGPGRRRRRRVLDGRGRRRLRQRRLDRPLRDGRQPEHPLPEPGRRDLRGRDRLRPGWPASCPGGARSGRWARAGSTTTATGTWTSSSSTTASGASGRTRCAGPRGGLPDLLPPGRVRSPAQHPLPEQRRRHLHRRLGGVGHRRAPRARGWAWPSPTTTPTGGRTSSSRTTPGATSSSGTAATGPSRRRGSARESPTSTRGGPSREWGPTSRTTTATGGRTSS